MSTDSERKLHDLRSHRYEHPGKAYPPALLPTWNDMSALLSRESAAVNYFVELIGDLSSQIEALQKRVEQLEEEKP